MNVDPQMQYFLDTNILVYAYDRSAGQKHEQAVQLMESCWENENGCLSVQVLQELYVTLVRKKVRASDARETVMNYLEWDVIDNDRALLLDGMRLQDQYSISFWDALIVAAAKRAKIKELWSEDLNQGQHYDGLVVINPFEKK